MNKKKDKSVEKSMPGPIQALSQQVALRHYELQGVLPEQKSVDQFEPSRPETKLTSISLPERVHHVLIGAQTSIPTWGCHFFPVDRNVRLEEPHLYSSGGVTEKYDQATGSQSTDYERRNNSQAVDWAEHCDHASAVACLLQKPSKSVTYNKTTFEPIDIHGLLIMVIIDLQKFDVINFVDSEEHPHLLMPILSRWTQEDSPYILDIGTKGEVRNYPFDKTKVSETISDTTRYQIWEVSSTGYPENTCLFKSWIKYDSAGNMIDSGWFGNPISTAWKPVSIGDLSKKENWPKRCSYNPEIDPKIVYEIYRKSL